MDFAHVHKAVGDEQLLDGGEKRVERASLREGMGVRFRKLNRLRKKSEFEEVFKNGKKYRGSFVTLVLLQRGSQQSTRLGLVVSRKTGKAVHRSRLKRWLRELFRLSLPCLSPGFDMVIVCRPGCEPRNFWQLYEEWRQLCEKGGILTDELPLLTP